MKTQLVISLLAAASALSAATPQWPQFRGPNASGVADEARPPIHFGPDTNLLWKIAVPPGISAPIVWGDHLFLTALASNQLITLAYDARNGCELWRCVRTGGENRVVQQIQFARRLHPLHRW
jgi:hypothetical protein